MRTVPRSTHSDSLHIEIIITLFYSNSFHPPYRLDISEEDAERMIDEADRDHDKQISFEDFSDILV